MAEIVISVDRGDHAERLGANERLQMHAYAQVTGYLLTSLAHAQTSLDRDCRSTERQDSRDLPRVHDAIFIEGGRGTGKTAFILNLRSQVPDADARRIHFCEPIDPTLLNEGESFLNVVIAKLHDEVKQRSGKPERNDRHHSDHRASYYEALEAVSHGMEALEGKDQAPGMERILVHRNGLGLQRHLQRYYREVCHALDCDLLVLPVDDADMAPHWAFEILDVIRRYFACPLIVPVVTGDIRQYRHIVAREFNEKLNSNAEPKYKPVAELAEQYLNKVLPIHRRTRLLTVPELLERHTLFVKQGERAIRFTAFRDFYKHVIYRRTNGEEGSHPSFVPGTTRGLIQWLLATAKPILDVEALRAIDAKNPDDLEKQVRDVAWSLRENTDEAVRSRFRRIVEAICAYGSSSGKWVDYHRGQADLRMAEVALSDRPAWPLRDLVWLDALRQPQEQADYPWPEVVEEALRASDNPIPRGHEFPRTLVAFPPLEPFSVDAIFSKGDMAGVNDPETRFLARVFSYNNYYSSYQTTNLVFFGRAFEIVTSSLLGRYDERICARILRDAPYHSYFRAFPTKTLDEVGEADAVAVAGDEGLDEFLITFVKNVQNWQEKHVGARPSAQLVQKAMNKAFNVFTQMKRRRILTGDSLFDVIDRCRRVLLNSFASFEKSPLDGDPIIVRQSVALEKRTTVPRAGEWENDPSFRFNVKPLLVKGSVTHAINAHPLFATLETSDGATRALMVRSTSGSAPVVQNSPPSDKPGDAPSPGNRLRRILANNKVLIETAARSPRSDALHRSIVSFIDAIKADKYAEIIKYYISDCVNNNKSNVSIERLLNAVAAQGADDHLIDWIKS
ncbi:hypothetical protein [Roseomonas genomospecies 6]|uniref:Uncharacterized protein n=1 Tax=Roseomonas genomospecies 6 TaxID=214106 RepID=A0A9W7KR04_9PROT|nr:hypothetical protein [Roseomonas genomospecies 6]KAA0677940.1 hypothetical protein DS843_21635 [Roseomonas genomospecies 6]